jgi:hypothetical protein
VGGEGKAGLIEDNMSKNKNFASGQVETTITLVGGGIS